jgi:hypothetical protein
MSEFLVIRKLPGISPEQLAQAQQAAIQTAESLRGQGTNIEYVRSLFLPGGADCMCLFRADNQDDVRRLNEQAGLPFDRIEPALDLSP